MAEEEIKFIDAACPLCGGRIQDTPKLFICENSSRMQNAEGEWVDSGTCTWRLFKNYRGAHISATLLTRLLQGEQASISCRTQDGDPYEANVALDPSQMYRVAPAKKVFGVCPVCGGKLIEGARGISCENRIMRQKDGAWVNEGTCDAWCPKVLCQRSLAPTEMEDLINGKEVHLDGLISRKGKAFSAKVKIDREDSWKPVYLFED